MLVGQAVCVRLLLSLFGAALLRNTCAAAAGTWLLRLEIPRALWRRAPAFAVLPLQRRRLECERRKEVGGQRATSSPGLFALLHWSTASWSAKAAVHHEALQTACLGSSLLMLTRTRSGSVAPARRKGTDASTPDTGSEDGDSRPVQLVAKLEEAESATEALWPQKKRGAEATAPAKSRTKRQKSAAAPAQVDVDAKEDSRLPTRKPNATSAAAGKGGIALEAGSIPGASAATAPPPAAKGKGMGKQKPASSESSPASSPSKKRVPIVPGSLPPPEGWREIYDLVWELRRERDAPVDWAGCETVGKGNEFHILIALMLSSQTKDQVVSEAMTNLKSWPRGGLSVASILNMSDKELDTLIAKVGFHNNKTKFIKQTAQILQDKYKGRVPQTAEELCSLPGIGPKMAYIILSAAFGIVDGIGVDTHMHRIFNVLHWVSSKTPEQTREQLEGWLPRPEWPHINVLTVGLGQGIQQPAERHRLLRRCVDCSRPSDALRLVHLLGADISSAADKVSGDTALMYAVRQRNLAVYLSCALLFCSSCTPACARVRPLSHHHHLLHLLFSLQRVI
jgi:endonuclease-3